MEKCILFVDILAVPLALFAFCLLLFAADRYLSCLRRRIAKYFNAANGRLPVSIGTAHAHGNR